jgi:hypothetical protein
VELEVEEQAGGRSQAGGGAQAHHTTPRAKPHREPLTHFDLAKKLIGLYREQLQWHFRNGTIWAWSDLWGVP